MQFIELIFLVADSNQECEIRFHITNSLKRRAYYDFHVIETERLLLKNIGYDVLLRQYFYFQLLYSKLNLRQTRNNSYDGGIAS